MSMGGNIRSNRGNVLLYCLIMVIWFVVCLYFPEWMPRCLLQLVSGYDCPACGAQRAIRCFSRGELQAGFWCNPYLIILLPYVLLLLIAEFGGIKTAKLYKQLTDIKVIILLTFFMLGWWVLRNTSLWNEIMERCGVQMIMCC